jgi:hypothetical protein
VSEQRMLQGLLHQLNTNSALVEEATAATATCERLRRRVAELDELQAQSKRENEKTLKSMLVVLRVCVCMHTCVFVRVCVCLHMCTCVCVRVLVWSCRCLFAYLHTC